MADQKITGLTADTAPDSADLVTTVDDVAGTPTNKKVTLADLGKGLTTIPGATDIAVTNTTDANLLDLTNTTTTASDIMSITKADANNNAGLYITDASTTNRVWLGRASGSEGSNAFSRNLSAPNGPVMFIKNDHASSTEESLEIDHDGSGDAMKIAKIDGNNNAAIYLTNDAATNRAWLGRESGSEGSYAFSRNMAAPNGPVMFVKQDEPTNAEACLELEQDSTSDPALKILKGTMMIKEQAAAQADVAAYGQLWVKTATPNQLWFTDDAGTDTQLGAGGGGGASPYDATVGSGGDYADFQAAIDAGKVNLLMVSAVTEDSDITLTADTVIDLQSYKLTFGATFAFEQATFYLKIHGNGIESGAEVEMSGNAGIVFNNGDTEMNDFLLDCSAKTFNVGNAFVWSSTSRQLNARNMKIALQNAGGSGINIAGGAGNDSSVHNIHFVGGGTTCDEALHLEGQNNTVSASDIKLSGSFANGWTIEMERWSILTNLHSDCATDIFVRVGIRSSLSNVVDAGSGINIAFFDGGNQLSNAYLGAGNVDFEAYDENLISNVTSTGIIDLSDAGANNNQISNCHFDGALTIAGDSNKISNSWIEGAISVSSGADDNGFSNTQCSSTITVVSGSNRTRIMGCQTNTAISDSGTDTEAWGNTIY